MSPLPRAREDHGGASLLQPRAKHLRPEDEDLDALEFEYDLDCRGAKEEEEEQWSRLRSSTWARRRGPSPAQQDDDADEGDDRDPFLWDVLPRAELSMKTVYCESPRTCANQATPSFASNLCRSARRLAGGGAGVCPTRRGVRVRVSLPARPRAARRPASAIGGPAGTAKQEDRQCAVESRRGRSSAD